MKSAQIKKLVPLQQMKFDHVCQTYKSAALEVEELRQQTDALRGPLAATSKLEVTDHILRQKHESWRVQKLIELNIVLAGKMAVREDARAVCVKEFGRLQALKKILAGMQAA